MTVPWIAVSGLLYAVFCVQICHANTVPSQISRMVDDIPYAKVFTNHDKTFEVSSGISMTSTQYYKNYSLSEIVESFNSSMISRSFLERGTFNRLLYKLSHKLHLVTKEFKPSTRQDKSKRRITLPLHLLFVGGSVCYGHHTFYNESVDTPAVTANITAVMRASAHLSWPRRLVALLNYTVTEYIELLSPLQGLTVQLQISPRYCCRQATSTTHAVDIFKSLQYRFGRCSHDLLDLTPPLPSPPPWEPDLVLWDYAVNDLNSKWFLSRPREYVYENMVKMAFKSHAAQIIDFEFINHFTPPLQMKTAVSQRQKVNRHYDIPMVDYMTSLSSNDMLRDWTPLYAERLTNKHPAWPTHVVWAQLALGVILTGLMQWKDFLAAGAGAGAVTRQGRGSNLLFPQLTPFAKYNDSHPLTLHNSPPNHKEYLGICNNHGYSSFYDFSDIKDNVDMTLYRAFPGIAPVKMQGNWRLGSELPLEPMKTGWMYCQHPHGSACTLTTSFKGDALHPTPPAEEKADAIMLDHTLNQNTFYRDGTDVSNNVSRCRSEKDHHDGHCHCKLDDHNILAFRCPNISIGDVKMEYMTSYGEEWGSVILHTNVKYKQSPTVANQDGRYELPTLPPVVVNSMWKKDQAAVSISQEIEISVHDMHSLAADGKVVVADIEYVDVVIRMCTQSGKKFKVLSIACC